MIMTKMGSSGHCVGSTSLESSSQATIGVSGQMHTGKASSRSIHWICRIKPSDLLVFWLLCFKFVLVLGIFSWSLAMVTPASLQRYFNLPLLVVVFFTPIIASTTQNSGNLHHFFRFFHFLDYILFLALLLSEFF